MSPKQTSLLLFVGLSLVVGTAVSGWMADGLARGSIEDQVGEQRLEEACNTLSVEWEYLGIYAVDGQRLAYSSTDLITMLRHNQYPKAEENATIVCRLDQGFLSDSEEKMTVNFTETNEQ